MIKEGTYQDSNDAVRLIKNSYLGYYDVNGFVPCELPYAYKAYHMHVNHPDMNAFLYYVDGADTFAPSGILMTHTTDFIFGPHKVAKDTLWWIEPDARSWQAMKQMVKYFEEWAISQGCNLLGLAHMGDERVGKLYNRLGYNAVETHYLKLLQSQSG